MSGGQLFPDGLHQKHNLATSCEYSLGRHKVHGILELRSILPWLKSCPKIHVNWLIESQDVTDRMPMEESLKKSLSCEGKGHEYLHVQWVTLNTRETLETIQG